MKKTKDGIKIKTAKKTWLITSKKEAIIIEGKLKIKANCQARTKTRTKTGPCFDPCMAFFVTH
jgi:hypothetical protein